MLEKTRKKILSAYPKADRPTLRRLGRIQESPDMEDALKAHLEGPFGHSTKKFLDRVSKMFFKHRLFRNENAFRHFLLKAARDLRCGKKMRKGWNGLKQFSPESLELLARHGRFFTPHPKCAELRRLMGPARQHHCHETAVVFIICWNEGLAKKQVTERMLYAEGLDMSWVWRPMLHCWNTLRGRSGTAVDWGCYASAQWTRYFGIVLHFDELRAIWETPVRSDTALLFDKRNFKKIRDNLEKVLASRIPAS